MTTGQTSVPQHVPLGAHVVPPDGLPVEAVFGDRLDRLMTVEVRPASGGLPSGIVVPMYEATRRAFGQPLSTLAARRLTECVPRGGTVIVATGAGVPPNLPAGETDGPPGAAALARAIAKAFHGRAILVTEERHLPAVEAVADVIRSDGLTCGSIETSSFPTGYVAGQEAAKALIEAYKPSAVIFVERDGPNLEGHFHGVRGDCRGPESVGHVYLLAEHAERMGILTIGIGDGGNEVGFGAVRDAVVGILPMNGRCLHGCASGVVTSTKTDVLVSASISNWGAYAVSAALAIAFKSPDLLHTPDMERELIEATVKAGARDGADSRASVSVDGISADGHMGFVALLSNIVAVAIGPTNNPAVQR